MATEKGIVFKVTDDIAWVKTSRSSACESCSERKSCHVSADGKEMEVEAINAIGARVDDKVVLYMKSSALLKASFLLYVFPIIVMLLAALLGQQAAPRLDLNPTALAPVGGIAGFILAFLFVRRKSRQMGECQDYKPKIIRILR
jgi:sigma-E factor negative regulatory protein RseC